MFNSAISEPQAPYYKKVHLQLCKFKSCGKSAKALGHLLCDEHLEQYIEDMCNRNREHYV